MRPLTTSSEQELEIVDEEWEEPLPVRRGARWWVRLSLVGTALALMVVFGVAIWLNPYKTNGEARRMETHTQLGLRPCALKEKIGLPCPSCGMTTSFSLLMRGDLWNSMQANFAGTFLALSGLLFIPWALASAYAGRPLGIRDFEWWLCRFIIVLVALMLVRWTYVLILFFL